MKLSSWTPNTINQIPGFKTMFRLAKAEEAPNNALQPTRGERVSSTAKDAVAETRPPLAAECDVMRRRE